MTSIRFVSLSVAAMSALLNGDLAGGSVLAGVQLSDYFISDRAKGLWRRRVNQIAEDPSAEPWVARAAISAETGYAVGYAGFHGPPDEVGMVEIGYTVVPESRRQGYAKAMLGSLIQFATDEPSVHVVRLTISPDNEASLATMRGFGFEHKGEQWDDEDGLELIYEIPA